MKSGLEHYRPGWANKSKGVDEFKHRFFSEDGADAKPRSGAPSSCSFPPFSRGHQLGSFLRSCRLTRGPRRFSSPRETSLLPRMLSRALHPLRFLACYTSSFLYKFSSGFQRFVTVSVGPRKECAERTLGFLRTVCSVSFTSCV